MQDSFKKLATRFVDIDQRIAEAAEMVKSFLEKSWKPIKGKTYTTQTLEIKPSVLGYNVYAVTHYRETNGSTGGTAFTVHLNKDGSFQVDGNSKHSFDIFSHEAEDLATAIIIDMQNNAILKRCDYDYDQGIVQVRQTGTIQNARISARKIVADKRPLN